MVVLVAAAILVAEMEILLVAAIEIPLRMIPLRRMVKALIQMKVHPTRKKELSRKLRNHLNQKLILLLMRSIRLLRNLLPLLPSVHLQKTKRYPSLVGVSLIALMKIQRKRCVYGLKCILTLHFNP